MKTLYEFGLTDSDIKDMIEICPTIINLSDDEINRNIEILKQIDCQEEHIINILTSNPFYLDRNSDDIINLINTLKHYNISNINLLFDTNPFLLNKNDYEIDNYIEQEKKLGKSIDDIIDLLESNPYIIDES